MLSVLFATEAGYTIKLIKKNHFAEANYHFGDVNYHLAGKNLEKPILFFCRGKKIELQGLCLLTFSFCTLLILKMVNF